MRPKHFDKHPEAWSKVQEQLKNALRTHTDLLRQHQTSPLSTLPKSPISSPQGTAVIIEPRQHEFLEMAIRNVREYIGHSWNITLFTHWPDWVREQMPDVPIDIR